MWYNGGMELSYWYIIIVPWLLAFGLLALGIYYLVKGQRHLAQAELDTTVRETEAYVKELDKSLRQSAKEKANLIQSLKDADTRPEAEKLLAMNEPTSPLLNSITRTEDITAKRWQRASRILLHLYAKGGTRGGKAGEIYQLRATKDLAKAASFLAGASILIGVSTILITLSA
jgi:hypothetical protein